MENNNRRIPFTPRIPIPSGFLRSAILPGPTKARLQVPFDLYYGSLKQRLDTPFCYFSSNTSCKVDQLYIPVEISIVEFNFEQGVTRNYHKILEQNSIPTGLSYECALQMLKHRIDAEAHTQEGSNYEASIFQEIVEFFNSQPSIILFCEDNKLEQNLSILNWFHRKFRQQTPGCQYSVRLYGIKQLADHFLLNSGSQLSKTSLSHLLQKSFFDSFLSNTCHYHRVLQSNLCTMDDAYKTAYAFIFAMSVINNLELGSQIPELDNMKPFLNKIALRYSK